jgi:hypothetical protein
MIRAAVLRSGPDVARQRATIRPLAAVDIFAAAPELLQRNMRADAPPHTDGSGEAGFAMDREQVTPISKAPAAAELDQAALYAAGFNRLVSAGHALIDGCQAVSAEMLAFWQSRLKEDLATGQRLLECASAEGALEIQLEYAKAALQAYADQSARIGALASRSLARMCEPARPASAATTALAA